jgi:hypothetical protein
MCWNPDISINTFVFSVLVLFFIFFTNTFSKYKSKTFDNPLVYLFFFEVVSMQLIEYFLWRNLKNNLINSALSKFASVLTATQIGTIMLMIPNFHMKIFAFVSYFLYFIFYFEYRRIYNPIIFHTSIGGNGHLSWEWMNYKGYENVFLFIFLLFYIIPALMIGNTTLSFLIILSIIVSFFFYHRYNTFGTMWCWASNFFLLYFICDILIIQPYYEYNELC